MSTFLGLIQEIPGISVDRFDGENLKSSVFFLSHCHSDHMIGLNDTFFKSLQQFKKYLYCSRISKVILESRYNFEQSCVKVIDIDVPTFVQYKLEDNIPIVISVTCISAGHCPGSVMFLFEYNGISVLYTGDFRINPVDFPKLKYLHYREVSGSLPYRFDKIYLDTTFLTHDFSYLPTRQESISKMSEVIKSWLNKDPRNVVILECSALYGSEFLFMELSKTFNQRIHIKDHVSESYYRIVELSQYITTDPYSTRIHACKHKFSNRSLKCRDDIADVNILTIIPSVMKWKGKDTKKIGEWDNVKEKTYNVCYSTHPSFLELKAFVQYFKPLDIFPSVCPEGSKEKVHKLLYELKVEPEHQISVDESTYTLKLPPCKALNEPFKSEYFSDDSDNC